MLLEQTQDGATCDCCYFEYDAKKVRRYCDYLHDVLEMTLDGDIHCRQFKPKRRS